MAERRMFAKTIVNSDAFTDMPLSAQALYLHIAIEADDWGFVNNPKAIRRSTGASEDDLRLLVAKRFLIAFDSGVVAVKHWWVNNYIKPDRRHQTKYQDELSMLFVDENKSYTFADTGSLAAETFSSVSKVSPTCIQNGSKMDPKCLQPVSKMDTEVRLGKDRLGESSNSSRVDTQPNPKGLSGRGVSGEEGAKAPKTKRASFVKPTVEEVRAYIAEKGYSVDAEKFWNFYEAKDWYIGKNKMKRWHNAVATWARSGPDSRQTARVDQQSLDAFDYAVGLGKGIA